MVWCHVFTNFYSIYLLEAILESEDDAVQDLVTLSIPKNASRKRRSSVIANDSKVKDLLKALKDGDISCTAFLRKVSRTTQRSFNQGLDFDDDFA